jgi:uncharacterized protein YhjY with autotransporter beta-barrel domain
MMIKKISGRHAVSGLAGISACLFFCNTAFAWQQEYIVSDAQSNTAERYTWDADHQPRYEDILAERIQSSQNAPGLALSLPSWFHAGRGHERGLEHSGVRGVSRPVR